MDWSLASLLPLLAVFLLAGLVKGVTGLGLPTVAIALLSLFRSPAEAAALLLLPSLVTNLWQGLNGMALALLLRRLWPLLLAIMAGLAGGSALGRGLLGGSLSTWPLGALLLVYAAWSLCQPDMALKNAWARWLTVPAGLLTGLLTALTGVFVMPLVPYLQALGLSRDAMIQALGLGFSAATLGLAAALAAGDLLPPALLWLSALALLPSLLGLLLGQLLRRRLSPRAFRLSFLLALAALGLQLLLR